MESMRLWQVLITDIRTRALSETRYAISPDRVQPDPDRYKDTREGRPYRPRYPPHRDNAWQRPNDRSAGRHRDMNTNTHSTNADFNDLMKMCLLKLMT